MIDWNDNVKAALQAFEDYLRENGVDGFDNGYFLQSFYSEFDPDYDKPTQKTVADAVEQEGEKWTHTYNALKCRVLIAEPDREGYIVVINELNEYYCVEDEDLKPIKPTMTKAEAWDYAVASGLYAEEIESKYDII